MRRIRFLFAFLAAVGVTACLEASPFVPKIEDVTFAPSLGVDLSNSTRTTSGLYYRDIVVGDGAQVRADSGGDTVSVRYTGYLRSGVEFDSNVASPGPLTFVTGRFQVIDGFDEGVRGMRVNGRRQIIIPPALGYGNRANGDIPANSILVFDVTLTRVGIPVPAP